MEITVGNIVLLPFFKEITLVIFAGMDPVNERKMFQQLVRAASQPNTPQ